MAFPQTATPTIRLAHVGGEPRAATLIRVLSRVPQVVMTTQADEKTATDQLFSQHADSFDAVIVQAPFAQRLSLAQRALAHNKHVYVNSPVAHDPQAIADLDRQFQSAGLCLTIAQPQRHLPAVQSVKQALDSRQLGDPGLLRLHRWETPDNAAASSSNGDGIRPMQPDLDLARWLFGTMPLTIYATGNRAQPQQTGDAAYRQIHLGFPDGGMALIDYTAALKGHTDYVSFSMIGSTGAAYADDHHNQQLLFHGDSGPTALRTGQGDFALLNSLREFVDGINGQGDKKTDNLLERDAVTITLGAQLSFDHHRPVQRQEGRYELA